MMKRQLSYWLDANNDIVKVNDTWDANMDSKCWTERASSHYIIGKHLFEFICDDVTRMYVSTMIDSVRLIPKTIVKPYRCDSSDCKRFMEMKIFPDENGLICLVHELVREEPLVNPVYFKAVSAGEQQTDAPKNNVRRTGFFIRCSICNRLKDRKTKLWQEIEALDDNDPAEANELNVIYGVCPACLEGLAKHI
jgi:hypothetical protein